MNNIHNASQEKAKPLSAEAAVNTEKGQAQQTTVQGIAKVTDGEVEVKLREGKTAPLADVEFTNPTLGSLYEAAGNYVTGTAKAFVAGYDGSLPLTQYQAAFEFIHNQAVKGVAMDAAVEAAGDVGQQLSNSARKLAYNSGLRDAQVLHSPADNGRIEAENVMSPTMDNSALVDEKINQKMLEQGVDVSNYEMYRKKKDTLLIEPMPKRQLQRIVKAFKKSGGIIQMDNETDTYLESKKAEAITLNENTILLRQKPNRASVFEELIHAAQLRQGLNDGSLISRLENEIAAQKMLLRNSKAYKLTLTEIKQTESALEMYTRELEALLKEEK